jgi:SAM-dependent methyltransferase
LTQAQAIEFIRPAIDGGSRWADLGAGTGTFTRALAGLLGEGAAVIAIDNDPAAVRALELLSDRDSVGATIIAAAGDLRDLEAVHPLAEQPLDGVLLANALHYVRDPVPPLAALGRLVRPGGRIVVIEYESRWANPWVPYPLPASRLAGAVRRAGLRGLEVVSTRPSRYHRSMYCAVTEVPAATQGTA